MIQFEIQLRDRLNKLISVSTYESEASKDNAVVAARADQKVVSIAVRDLRPSDPANGIIYR